jgi:hypothetical protein
MNGYEIVLKYFKYMPFQTLRHFLYNLCNFNLNWTLRSAINFRSVHVIENTCRIECSRYCGVSLDQGVISNQLDG